MSFSFFMIINYYPNYKFNLKAIVGRITHLFLLLADQKPKPPHVGLNTLVQ